MHDRPYFYIHRRPRGERSAHAAERELRIMLTCAAGGLRVVCWCWGSFGTGLMTSERSASTVQSRSRSAGSAFGRCAGRPDRWLGPVALLRPGYRSGSAGDADAESGSSAVGACGLTYEVGTCQTATC